MSVSVVLLAVFLYGFLPTAFVYFLLGFNWLWIWKLRHLPGPRSIGPYIGHFPKENSQYMHYKLLFQWPKIYGPVYRLFLGQVPYVVVTDAELVEQICTRQFAKFHDRNPLPLGTQVTDDDKEQFWSNIFWASGKQWSSVRSACEPLFHSSTLDSYGPAMHQSIDQWMKLMDKLGQGGKGVDVIDPINGLCMSMLGRANFGVDFDCQSEEPARLVKEAFFQMAPPADVQQAQIWLLCLPMFLPLLKGFFTYLYRWGYCGKAGNHTNFTFARSEGYLNGTTMALIKNARLGGKDTAGRPAVETPVPSKDLAPYRYHQLLGQSEAASFYKDKVPAPGSFIPRLVEAKIRLPGKEPKSLTDAQIVAQAYSVILAGYDSPANALSHCLYQLAMNPGVQARLIQEVDSLGPDARPSYKDIATVPYVEATFQETLRLYPAGNPMYSPCRRCTKDTELGGFKIPAGVGIMLNSTGYSRDAKYFPDPLAFKPERHIPGTPGIGPETRPPTAHMPFGYGPHGCLGRKFAIQQAVSTLVRFFQKYAVTIDEAHHPPGHKLWTRNSITFQPDHGGLWVKMHPRSRAVENEE